MPRILLFLSSLPFLFAALVSPEALEAQTPQPIGDAFVVSDPEPDTNFRPSVAADADGNFVVVWGSGFYPTMEYPAFGRRFSSNGQPLGSSFEITDDSSSARIAMASDGHFVVSWRTEGDLIAQRFDPQANPIGRPETVAGDARPQHEIAMGDNGDFLVVWLAPDGDGNGLFGRRFPSSAPASPPFQLNTYTTGNQGVSQYGRWMGQDAAGRFVVSWFEGDLPDLTVNARLFQADGSPSSAQFEVSSPVDRVFHQSVDMAPDGQFVVAWSGYDSGDSSDYRLLAHRFDSTGNPLGNEFQVNSITTGIQYVPIVDIDTDGDFVVLWRGAFDPDTGVDNALGGRRFSSDGTPQGVDFVVRGGQFVAREARLAHQAHGEFTVVFQGGTGYGYSGDIMARRFASSLFYDGFESGDTSAWSSSQPRLQ